MLSPSEYMICNCVLEGSNDEYSLLEYEIDNAMLESLDAGKGSTSPAFRLLKFVYNLEAETGKVAAAEKAFGWLIQWFKDQKLIKPRMRGEDFTGVKELDGFGFHFTEFMGAAKKLKDAKKEDFPLLAVAVDAREPLQSQLVQAYAKRMLARQ